MSLKRASVLPLLHEIRWPHLLISVERAAGARLLTKMAAASVIISFAIFLLLPTPLFAAGVHERDASVRRAQQASNCVELVMNGGFEQRAAGWNSMAGASLFTYAADQHVGGQLSLLLGSTEPLSMTATFGVEQPLTFPAESSSINLSFYYDLTLDGVASSGDQAYLAIFDVATNQSLAMVTLFPATDTAGNPSGDVVSATKNITTSNTTGRAWKTGRYDLSAFSGKSIRLAFVVQNDGEPGWLAMRVDDVSILACLPPGALATQFPAPTSAVSEPVQSSPSLSLTISPPVSQSTPALSEAAPTAPQAKSTFPQAGTIHSLEACRCDSSLYTCADFSSWSVAQACYTQCQVATGYDIHNLDPDRNGIACELELNDAAPLESTPTPSIVTGTNPVTTETVATDIDSTDTSSATSSSVGGGVTGVATAIVVLPAEPLGVGENGAPSMPITTSAVVTAAEAMSATDAVTSSRSLGGKIVAAPTVERTGNSAPSPDSPPLPSSSLSPMQMLFALLFSPLGFVAIGALVILGALSLWVAYLVGQRDILGTKPPTDSSTDNPSLPDH
jgi:hypothetical protein